MREIRLITDDAGAIALADRLNGQGRQRPIVVITIPAGGSVPFIDAEKVIEEVGDLADVYLIATGPHTWTFSSKMPELTQVYGGAGRVYPVGHEWVTRPYSSPLRFAYNMDEGLRSTRALVSDTLRSAAETGLLRQAPSRHRTRIEGSVIGIPVPERALVKFEGGLAPVAQELTFPDVPLDRVVSVGMTVSGWYDSETRRLDISDSLLAPEAGLADYAVGDVVLAEVGVVHAEMAELMLHPRLAVRVSRDDVTANDLDDLRNLLTPGEVVSGRLTSLGPNWRLTLLDVDETATPRAAASVLAGGPPWLAPPPDDEALPSWVDEPPVVLARVSPQEPPAARPEPDLTREDAPSAPTPPPRARVSPAIFDRKRAATPAPGPTAVRSAAAATMALTIDALRAELATTGRELLTLRGEMRASAAERQALVESRQDQERRLARLEHELKGQRSRLRKAKQSPSASGAASPDFADPEQGFRYAVLTSWATRTPVGEQLARPLPDYDLGPEFLASVRQTPGISLGKLADVVFEVVTGRAPEIAGRDLHQLRESATPHAPHLRRAADDATCWRAALQVNTPQARRLHYWVAPGGRVELSRVALHDDVRP